MRTCRYHFGDHRSQTLLPFLLFFVSRQKEEWWSKKFFPRGCLSLSLVLCAKRRLFRETETPTTFSLLSLKRFRFDRGEKTTTRAFVLEDFRARVFGSNSLSTDGKNRSPKALRSVSVLYFSRDRKTHEKRRPRVLALSLDGLATSARLSRSRIRECKEREKRSKICAEISFFSSFLYSPIKCSQFSQRAGESEPTTRCEIFSDPTHTGRRRRRRSRRKKGTDLS